MTFNEFKTKWDDIPPMSNGFLALDIKHPLALQIGYHNSSYKAFIIMDTGIVKDIPSSFAVNAVNSELQNGKWILEFQLVHEAFEEEFLRLCWDIIESTKNSSSPLTDLIKRYLSWQKFLQYINKNVLSYQSQKGLLGELLFLIECIDKNGAETAVTAWKGPDGSDQDFLFSDTWTEIKTVALSSNTVKISSLEQLQQETEGYLVVYVLEKSVPGKDRYNLSSVVSIVRSKLSIYPLILDGFDTKLFKTGYRKNDEDEYKKNNFRYVERRQYLVNEEFPKIIRKSTDPAITSCNYEISLPALEAYRR